jgi:hypothetical protein
MTVLTIRTHRRYAVRQMVRLGRDGGKPLSGLMIELSSEGCRISNLGRPGLTIGEEVSVDVEGTKLHGYIRWTHDGIAGVRLAKALHPAQLGTLIARGRGEAAAELALYGT